MCLRLRADHIAGDDHIDAAIQLAALGGAVVGDWIGFSESNRRDGIRSDIRRLSRRARAAGGWEVGEPGGLSAHAVKSYLTASLPRRVRLEKLEIRSTTSEINSNVRKEEMTPRATRKPKLATEATEKRELATDEHGLNTDKDKRGVRAGWSGRSILGVVEIGR